MVVTQSCDAVRRSHIALCPVYPVAKIFDDMKKNKSGDQKIENFLHQMREQKINYYFHLPAKTVANTSHPEAYVDLQVIISTPRQNLSFYKREVTLSDQGRHWLGHKLSLLFSRPFL